MVGIIIGFISGWVIAELIRIISKRRNHKSVIIRQIEKICKRKGIPIPKYLDEKHIIALRIIKEDIEKQPKNK